ncbi:MAG TPA: FtsX-like permease family protein [Candidatus Angelobacter sp.]|jgi:putative ABC transport system permease protein|nr:FtsX-like permease family protein [Candidatus Angelobacter sp.]
MNRSQLLLRMLVKAAWVRKDRSFTALLSITVVATITTVALSIYSEVGAKLNREFRKFGANVIVTAPAGALDDHQLSVIKNTMGSRGEVAPVAYAIAEGPSGAPLVIGGADLQSLRELNSWWSLTPEVGYVGQSESKPSEALLGARAAEVLSPHGQSFEIRFGKKSIAIHPAFVFHAGSDDDSRLYIDRTQFAALTGISANIAQIRIEGSPSEINNYIEKLRAALPQLEIKPVLQITTAQAATLEKTRSVVLAALAVVVVLIILCMVATLTGSVLERRKDFAVMKALGASNTSVNMLFAGEAMLISIVGALFGFVAGSAIAWWIGSANFGSGIPPRPGLLFPVAFGSIILALIASSAPLKVLRKIQPAGILRGE